MEPEALEPEPEVAALVVEPLAAGAVVEVPLLAVDVVPAAVVDPPDAALVSPFKQLLLAGHTFQRKTQRCGSLGTYDRSEW